jgi:WD40 repeat protein
MITHSGPISGIAAFGDRYLATAGYDNQVILWDQGTGHPIGRGLHDHLANQCAFSPDGTRLVTSSSDYTTRLWSVPGLRLLAVLNDAEDDVEMSVFHPTRELIATASRDHCVRVYDFAGELVRRFAGHKADVISVEWARDADELITSSDDGSVKRWSFSSGDMMEDIDLSGVETDTVAIGPDGVLYAGNDEGEIVVIRAENQTRIRAHQSGIKRLVLDTERGLLVSLSYDRMMRLWKMTGDQLAQVDAVSIPDDVWPRSCAFAAGSTLVLGTFGAIYRTYDYGRQTWLPTDVPPTYGLNAACPYLGAVLSVGDAGIVWRDGAELTRLGSLCNFLTPAGDIVLTGGQLGKLMDALTGRVIYQHRSPLNCATYVTRDDVPHAIVGAYTGEGLVFRLGPDGMAKHVADVPLQANAVKGVAASGDFIFSVCADRGVAWHDLTTLRLVHRVPGGHDRIANGCVGLGEGHFASVGRDLKLRLWSPGFSCEVISTPHTHSIKCVSASSDGDVIATGSYDGHVALYDRRSGTWPVIARPTASGISSLSYETARRFLASSYDGSVYEIG